MNSNNSGSCSPVRDSLQTCRWRFRCLLSPGSTQLTATILANTSASPQDLLWTKPAHDSTAQEGSLYRDSSPNIFSALNCPHSPTLKNRSVRMTR